MGGRLEVAIVLGSPINSGSGAMKRREFIGLIGGVLTASNSSQRVEAQQFNKLPFLGVLVAEAYQRSHCVNFAISL